MIDKKCLVRLQCDNCLTVFEQNGKQFLPITEQMVLSLAGKNGWEITTHDQSADIILALCPDCLKKKHNLKWLCETCVYVVDGCSENCGISDKTKRAKNNDVLMDGKAMTECADYRRREQDPDMVNDRRKEDAFINQAEEMRQSKKG